MSNHHIFLLPKFITTPSQNGVGRYVCQLKRLVFKFCKNHGSSRGMREFIEYDIVNYAKNYPETAVYLKPRRHRGPVIKAEYLNGDVQTIFCNGYSREDLNKWVNLLRTQSGNHEGTRYRKLYHTDYPSIQGPWTPYTFRDPALNLASFPSENLSKRLHQPKSTTEIFLEMYKEQQVKQS